MQKESCKIAILVSNHFEVSSFEAPLKMLTNIGNIDVISSESGKVKTWDKTIKEYHDLFLYKKDIHSTNAMEYGTLIVHEELLKKNAVTVNKEIVSFINKFMGRRKPIIAICKNEWTIIVNTKSENKTVELTNNSMKISA